VWHLLVGHSHYATFEIAAALRIQVKCRNARATGGPHTLWGLHLYAHLSYDSFQRGVLLLRVNEQGDIRFRVLPELEELLVRFPGTRGIAG
jgi:hypothetical protein